MRKEMATDAKTSTSSSAINVICGNHTILGRARQHCLLFIDNFFVVPLSLSNSMKEKREISPRNLRSVVTWGYADRLHLIIYLFTGGGWRWGCGVCEIFISLS